MGRMLIAYRNHIDAATLGGGSWSTGLPVGNLADPQPGRVARSAALEPEATLLTADLGAARPVQFVALVRHNLTQQARWRIRLGAEADQAGTAYDSGPVPVWPAVIPFGVGVWGEFLWGGLLAPEEAATYGLSSIHLLPDPVVARHLRIDLDDPANPDGFVQAGRLVAGPAWRPSVNLQYGWSLEQVDDSRRVRSRGGQTYVDRQPKFRRLRFVLDFLERDEIFGQAYELERLKGLGSDLLVVVDPDDGRHRHRQTVYGLLAESTPIANPIPDRFSKAFVIEELL